MERSIKVIGFIIVASMVLGRPSAGMGTTESKQDPWEVLESASAVSRSVRSYHEISTIKMSRLQADLLIHETVIEDVRRSDEDVYRRETDSRGTTVESLVYDQTDYERTSEEPNWRIKREKRASSGQEDWPGVEYQWDNRSVKLYDRVFVVPSGLAISYSPMEQALIVSGVTRHELPQLPGQLRRFLERIETALGPPSNDALWDDIEGVAVDEVSERFQIWILPGEHQVTRVESYLGYLRLGHQLASISVTHEYSRLNEPIELPSPLSDER